MQISVSPSFHFRESSHVVILLSKEKKLLLIGAVEEVPKYLWVQRFYSIFPDVEKRWGLMVCLEAFWNANPCLHDCLMVTFTTLNLKDVYFYPAKSLEILPLYGAQ